METVKGDLIHIEFQSTKERMLYRFLAYDVALAEKFQRDVRTIVIYTHQVADAPNTLSIGCALYRVENLFLYELDGDAVLDIVEHHLTTKTWSAADRIRLGFALHMRFSNDSTSTPFSRIINLTKQIRDPHEQSYVAAVILGISGRQLSAAQKQALRRAMAMTDLLRDIERDAVKRGWEEGREEGREKGREEGQFLKAVQVAHRLMAKGTPLLEIVDITGLTVDEVRKLQPPH